MRAGACHLLRIFGLRHKAVLLRRRVVARTLETPYRGPPCSRQHTGPSRSSPYTYTCAVSCVYQLCAEQRHFSASVRIRTIVADADVTGTIRDHTVYESGSRTTASAQYAGHRAQASEIGDHIFRVHKQDGTCDEELRGHFFFRSAYNASIAKNSSVTLATTESPAMSSCMGSRGRGFHGIPEYAVDHGV